MDDAAVRKACSAAYSGNMDSVEAALAAGPRGLTAALRAAAKLLKPDAVRVLAAAGADVGARSGTRSGINCTLLHKVVVKPLLRAIETTKVLIECGADVNLLDDFLGWTPLMHLVVENAVERLGEDYVAVDIAKILIGAGADVNYKDDEGTSALDLAAEDENIEMASILLGAGARVNGAKTYSPKMVEFFGAEDRWMRRKIWVAVSAER